MRSLMNVSDADPQITGVEDAIKDRSTTGLQDALSAVFTESLS
jgi:hypothetical protein